MGRVDIHREDHNPRTTTDVEHLLAESRKLLDSAINLHQAKCDDLPGVSRRDLDENWGHELVRLLRQARTEVILGVSNPLFGPRRTTGLYDSGWDAISQLARDGKQVQVLYSEAYLEACDRTHLLTRVSEGQLVRVVSADFQNLLIIDRRILVLWGGAGAMLPSASVIQFPALLDSMRVFAKMSWGSGAELGAHLASDSGLTEISIRVLAMLEKGAKDEVAARTLGVSLRTYRRYVAQILEQLDASTRFQAGARSAELGLLSAARCSDSAAPGFVQQSAFTSPGTSSRTFAPGYQCD